MQDRVFKNRREAGKELAQALAGEIGANDDVVVLALPRGGVPVGYEVAKALGAEFDVLIVRKLGLPSQPELAMGAIASGGAIDLNQDVIALAGVSQRDIDRVMAEESRELQRREAVYRGTRPAVRVQGRTVIVVDDGLATGASMRAALKALRTRRPARLIAAVPVAPFDAPQRLGDVCDAFVSVLRPANFQAVGQFYAVFDQTSDEEVRTLLAQFPGTGAHQ
jgi:putative phosphoribosyl transferase